jgi:hypothetical protein
MVALTLYWAPMFNSTALRNILRSPRLRFCRELYRDYFILPRLHRRFEAMQLREVFAAIYRERHWDTVYSQPYDSGSGSAEQFAGPYCDLISRFISERRIRTVVDLGCGDFRVGREVAALYIGVDIVPDLVTQRLPTAR